MNGFDYFVLGVLAVSVLIGVWRGLVREVLSIASWAAALWATKAFGMMGAQAMSHLFNDEMVQLAVGYVLVFVGTLMLCGGITALIRLAVTAVGLSFADRVLGAVFGCGRALMFLLVVTVIAGLTSIPQKPWWQEAKFSAPLETFALATRPWLPAQLAQQIRYPIR